MSEPTKKDLCAEIEALVATESLHHVLIALEIVCDEISYFVESPESIKAVPDKALARVWRKCARACRRAADVATELP